jgi:hypothetical protein
MQIAQGTGCEIEHPLAALEAALEADGRADDGGDPSAVAKQ